VEVGNSLSLVLLISTIMFRAMCAWPSILHVGSAILFISATVFFRKVRAAFRERDETEAELTSGRLPGRISRASGWFGAFANQEYRRSRRAFWAKNEVHRDKVYHLIWLLACYWGSSDFLAFFQIGFVLVAGAYFTAPGGDHHRHHGVVQPPILGCCSGRYATWGRLLHGHG